MLVRAGLTAPRQAVAAAASAAMTAAPPVVADLASKAVEDLVGELLTHRSEPVG